MFNEDEEVMQSQFTTRTPVTYTKDDGPEHSCSKDSGRVEVEGGVEKKGGCWRCETDASLSLLELCVHNVPLFF
jgi:hypothetical protein